MIQASHKASPDAGKLQKKLPVGISDYKEIIDGNFYYIDKTLLIDDILKYSRKVTLITRPRRFGKTLNLSMLKYFFEKTETSNAYLFEDKKIWQLPEYAAMQGKFPVIFLTLKDVKENTWELTRAKLISIIAEEYERHSYLLNSDQLSPNQKETYQQIVAKKAMDAEYHNSLQKLSQFLHHFHKVKVFVLLDEYDSPIHAGFMHDYYEQIIQFMAGFMGAAFKDNTYLEQGIITGILRTAKEGMFSGVNNLKVFTMLDDPMSDKFGFTNKEIQQLLKDYDHTQIFQEFKHWYNGYLIGNTQIYNPWSALYCIDKNGQFFPYWANTGDNSLIRKIIAQAQLNFKDTCADLIAGEVVKDIKIDDKMTLLSMTKQTNSAWSLLLFSGYVTSNSQYTLEEGIIHADLVLPNKELHVLFKQLVEDLFRENLNDAEINELNKALRQADGESFEYLLSKFVSQSMSVYDISSNEPEKSYHLFALGLLVMLANHYIVLSNRESGLGRFDIMLIPKEKSRPGIIIEFKKMSIKETMPECADRALQQIKEKNYAAQLQQHGIVKIVAFGIAIHKKEVLLKQEELSLIPFRKQ